MTDSEYYANPGRNLDTDDHERLIEENREAYLRDLHEELIRDLKALEREIDDL